MEQNVFPCTLIKIIIKEEPSKNNSSIKANTYND